MKEVAHSIYIDGPRLSRMDSNSNVWVPATIVIVADTKNKVILTGAKKPANINREEPASDDGKKLAGNDEKEPTSKDGKKPVGNDEKEPAKTSKKSQVSDRYGRRNLSSSSGTEVLLRYQ